MPKLVKCPICGRQNSMSSIRCSRCGSYLDIAVKEESPEYPVKRIEEKDIQNVLKDLNIDIPQPKKRFSFEVLYPNETKLFLFVNLSFTSLFIHILVQGNIFFILTYYPILYWFSCSWAAKKKIDWQNFLFQFALLILTFVSIFFIIPQLI